MKRALLGLLLAAQAYAAGTVQQTISQLGTSGNWVLAFNWTADGSGSVPVTAAKLGGCCNGYFVTQVETGPGSPAPTTGYSVQITDSGGVDLLAGAASSLSASPQAFTAASAAPPIQGNFSLILTGNAVPGAQGVVYVFLGETSLLGSAGGSTLLTWLNLPQKPVVDIRSFLAGSTTSGIQEAINALPSTGGTVIVPAGNWTLSPSATISIATGNVTLKGDSSAANILQTSGVTNMLSITANNVILQNLTFTGTGKTGGFAVYLNNASSTVFDNVSIAGVPNGYSINGSSTSVTRWNNGYISGLIGTTGVGISIGTTGSPIDNFIDRIIINGNGALADIQVHSTGSLTISNSDLILSNYPLEVIPATTGQVAIVYATNTYFDTGSINPLYVNATGGGVAQIGHFDNDWFATSLTDAGASLNGAVVDYVFNGCIFLNNWTHGISINGVTQVTVNGSTFANNTEGKSNNSADVYIAGGSSHVTITNNRFWSVGAIQIPYQNVLIGTGTVEYLTITGNDLTNSQPGNAQFVDNSTTTTNSVRTITGNLMPGMPTLASTATLALTPFSEIYQITGNTTISAMSPIWFGRVVKLVFVGSAPGGVASGGAASVNFLANKSAGIGQLLTCTYSGQGTGVNWICQ